MSFLLRSLVWFFGGIKRKAAVKPLQIIIICF